MQRDIPQLFVHNAGVLVRVGVRDHPVHIEGSGCLHCKYYLGYLEWERSETNKFMTKTFNEVGEF